jgi:hypothetical protein
MSAVLYLLAAFGKALIAIGVLLAMPGAALIAVGSVLDGMHEPN